MNTKRVDELLDRTVLSPNGCRIFAGCSQGNGYGRITEKMKTDYAHRVMYRHAYGEIPKGMDVCHRCDVRTCINPQHLFLGTRAENMADAVRKNRQAKGFALPHTKLTDIQRDEIAARANLGEPYKKIAKEFGISRQHAGQIAIKQGVKRNGVSK
jgi:hypothetical protein